MAAKKKKTTTRKTTTSKKKSGIKAKARPKVTKKKSASKTKTTRKTAKKSVAKKATKPKKAVKKTASRKSPKKKAVVKKTTAKKTTTKAAKKPSKPKRAAKKTAAKTTSTPKTKKAASTQSTPANLDPMISKIRDQLIQSRNELLSMIRTSQEVERNVGEITFSNEIDLASSLEGREMAFQLSSRERNELKMIEDALFRISKGTYGICENCSKPIGVKRLQIMPLTPLCIQCQENLEVG